MRALSEAGNGGVFTSSYRTLRPSTASSRFCSSASRVNPSVCPSARAKSVVLIPRRATSARASATCRTPWRIATGTGISTLMNSCFFSRPVEALVVLPVRDPFFTQQFVAERLADLVRCGEHDLSVIEVDPLDLFASLAVDTAGRAVSMNLHQHLGERHL